MNLLDAGLDINKAKRIFEATRQIKFANIPAIDMKDRLSVLTVASGLRKVGVLETWGQRLPRTRELMIDYGLFTSVATCVWSTIERPDTTPYHNVLHALDEKRVADKPQHVLWLYAEGQHRAQYRQLKFTQQQAGTLLQYPACCIAFESSFMKQWPQAQLDTLMAEADSDNAKLLAIVRGTKSLPSPKIELPDNGLRTEQSFPFVLHVACDACLASPDSPSAVLNSRYGALVNAVDPGFYELFLNVQKIFREIARDHIENQGLLQQILRSHATFFEAWGPKR
jgi:hypothetical protein